jgi:hypothetical protein
MTLYMAIIFVCGDWPVCGSGPECQCGFVKMEALKVTLLAKSVIIFFNISHTLLLAKFLDVLAAKQCLVFVGTLLDSMPVKRQVVRSII